jgi:hypothetical protein
VGAVAYGAIVLCRSCDMYRSAVGRTDAPRKVAGAELIELVGATRALALATERVGRAVGAARGAGASWAEVGDALGTTRQAAQQRFSTERFSTGRTSR